MTRAILLISSTLILFLMLQYVASVVTEASEKRWYCISGKNSISDEFQCKSCHPDFFAESESHVHAGEKKCMQCHRVEFECGISGFDNCYRGHFTSTISCLDCHVYSDEICEYDNGSTIPPAGGFGLTNCSKDKGTFAAHTSFLKILEDESESKNKACLACHTFMKLEIERSREVLEFNSEVTKAGSSGRWKLSDFRLNSSGYSAELLE